MRVIENRIKNNKPVIMAYLTKIGFNEILIDRNVPELKKIVDKIKENRMIVIDSKGKISKYELERLMLKADDLING
jgi:hypothetical protein